MIGGTLPAGVHHADTRTELTDPPLHPGEEEYIALSVDGRRREFTTTRACARRALAALGIASVPILPGVRGAPQWPAGVVGSMTHCTGYRAAAVASTADTLTVGIDAEVNEPLPDGVLEAVSFPHEAAAVHALGRTQPQVRWDRLLFSAKESVYKAWFPLTERFLTFEDARITWDVPGDGRTVTAGRFTAELLVGGPWPTGRLLPGRWNLQDGLLCTSIVLPARLRTPATTPNPTATHTTGPSEDKEYT
ncbi:4'-phosphopantetheinyl transferase [Streptomyces sp. NPDC004111]|uniref:4'-phosphopantetheinyl transferase family protein n=1 Tax=Streptomyces sp. NPDC004111 TaxID=3364690 RepID=UPI0036CDD09C